MRDGARGEILLTALVLSAVVHLGAMFYARPKVMTEVVSDSVRSTRREPMRVTPRAPRPEPVSLETVRDVDARKDAPAAVPVAEAPQTPAPDGERRTLPVPAVEPSVRETVRPKPTVDPLEVKPLSTARSSQPLPLLKPEPVRPMPAVAPAAAPAAAPLVNAAEKSVPPSPRPAVGTDPASLLRPVRLVPEKAPQADAPEFVPERKVRARLDEALVAREKAAVRDLLNVAETTELAKFANVVLSASEQDGWRYFKVSVSPRHDLPTVPKDLVILIDASGSIGRERIRSVREAAGRVLRTGTNSGDRFNLVAFRDRYEYCFDAWQGCTRSAFARADAWLDEVAAHGRTDVFATISSVLTLPRDPQRPLVALVVTDGEANSGVRETSEILSRFTALNDGLVSVYMYGVKTSGNRELIDVLTRGNRGESLIYDGWFRTAAGSELEGFVSRFRDPVLSDIRVVFAAGSRIEAYPRLVRNLYRNGTVDLVGRVPVGTKEIAFSLIGLNGGESYEGFFRLPLDTAAPDASLATRWQEERTIDLKLK